MIKHFSLSKLILLSWILACNNSATASPINRKNLKAEELIYEFKPIFNENELRFLVHLTFKGDSSGATKLILPSAWGGQKQFYNCIQNLRATTAAIETTATAHVKQLQHAPNQPVHVYYDLVQDWQGDLFGPGKTYRPILTNEYFHFIGHSAFVHPDWNDGKPLGVKLHWQNLPPDWKISNSFATGDTLQEMNISIGQLRHAVYVGGDFRIKQILLDENSVYVAMRGDWKFGDEEFFGLIEKIVWAQRTFWNDHDFPYYLITLIPTGEQCCSYGGTGLTNSFATFISTDKGIDFQMKHLLAHELLHTWIGQKISITDTPDQPEALLYWFSEGFTDYYTRELLLRAGLITLDEYIADYNKKIYEYYVSPARNAPNARVPDDFWQDRFVGKLPYQRGDLLAHRWNTKITAAQEGRFSLDDLMRYVLGLTKTSGFVVSDTAFNRVIQPYVTQEILGDLRKYIKKGETIPLDAEALGPKVRLEEVAMGPFDLGFDFDASHAQRRITGVQRNGPAFKAGLRNGQHLKGMSIYWNDPTKEVEFKIGEKGGEKTIRYLPVGKKSKIPQYRRIGE